jgi:hypothetical protein
MNKKLIHIIVLSCRTATRLIEKKLHQPLSPRERLQLSWHKGVCDACTTYEKQVIFLDGVLTRDPQNAPKENVFSEDRIASLQQQIIASMNT